jgi:nicotinate phosphoribosyltransferase
MAWVDDSNASLLTDLYELTMAASYHGHQMNYQSTFDLFIRQLPERRNFLVACGISDALHYLQTIRFEDDALQYLRSLEMFSDDFLTHLADFAFQGEVWAAPEGEIVFENEPLLRVTAPLIEAQIVETFLLNCIAFQTMVASKAARVAIACGDRRFLDMSPRRDHAADAALKAARAAYVGGAWGTSNVLAGHLYGIPVSGTMAHSYVMAFEDEERAFRAFVHDFPNNAVLLIDTFDVLEGAKRAARVAADVASEGVIVKGVRIDSGDLAPLTRSVRGILDSAGLEEVEIILSGDLDEYRITALLDDGVPVNSFGVGTQLGTSADAPALGAVYKLVEDERGPKIKLSTGKATLPGRKQVLRFDREGIFERDEIALEGEEARGGRPLLVKVMEKGERVDAVGGLEAARERCRAGLQQLPPTLRRLGAPAQRYRVEHSPRLAGLVEQMSAIDY